MSIENRGDPQFLADSMWMPEGSTVAVGERAL